MQTILVLALMAAGSWLSAGEPPKPMRPAIAPKAPAAATDGDTHLTGLASGCKGSLILNGADSCPFDAPGNKIVNFGCPSFFGKIHIGENTLEVRTERGVGSPQTPPRLDLELFTLAGGPRKSLQTWSLCSKSGTEKVAFNVGMPGAPAPAQSVTAKSAPIAGAQSTVLSPASSHPAQQAAQNDAAATAAREERRLKREKALADCSNEIGLFCNKARHDDSAALSCLRKYKPKLLKNCRESLEAYK